ncbi:MAG: tRNA uridine-5-carboxymethylaminomethyl(34) synthesis GTPase MnmE [Gammaproteobacteria bacterium]|jgi:tRNA modification GTPase
MPDTSDTIAAVATAAGQGGVGIVRVSGPAVRGIAAGICGRLPPARRAEYLAFRGNDGTALDNGIALFFSAPHSFTGEDVLELHGHGGPVVLDMLLSRVCGLGARPARPGEFSERAFLNDKLDLVQAEAIADLIASASREAARGALRSLEGEFSARIHALVEALIQLRLYVEAAIDFPEEEVDFLSDGHIAAQLASVIADLAGVMAAARQGRLLRDGMTVVIAGQPNAGKSSLLNTLAQRDAAIVTDVPGTTRDVLREYVHLDGLPLHVIDTAGLRNSSDPVESQGIQRAWTEIVKANRVLLVVDDQIGVTPQSLQILHRLPDGLAVTVVHNKIDLSGRDAALWHDELGEHVAISAKRGTGLTELKRHLKESMGYQSGGEGSFMARRRHLEALQNAARFLDHGKTALDTQRAGELLAEDLRMAQRNLGEITGEFSSDDLLGRIFSEFCIGK